MNRNGFSSPRGRSNPPWRRWAFPLLGFMLLFAAIGAGYAYLTRPFRAAVQLFAYERTFSSQAEAADFVAGTGSTGSIAKLTAKLPTWLSSENLAERCQVTVDQGQPYIASSVTAGDERSARALIEIFAGHVAASADEWVSKRTKEVDRQITAAQRRLRDLRKQFGDFDEALLFADVRSLRQTLAKQATDQAAAVTGLQSQLSNINAEEKKTIAILATDRPALRAIQQELERALTSYTEEHPHVKELRASLIALQKESLAKPGSRSAASRTNAQLAELNSRRGSVRDKLKKAEASELKSRQALQKFGSNEVEFVRLQSEYNALSTRRDELIQSRVLVGSKGVEKWRRSDRVEMARITDIARFRNFIAVGALAGLCVGSFRCSVTRRKRRIIRDVRSLEEITDLPVLAVLPELSEMAEPARQYWAIETLHMLRNTARAERRGCFVCGIISSTNGEGRSTWIDLLADAGLRNGNRVLVISRPDCTVSETASEGPADTLFAPLTPADPSASANIARFALIGDLANISLQKNWERAFTTWQNEENALVLVELPAATTADALLLSSAVPNVLWLAAANVAEAQTTFTCVKSLRNSGCRLLGAGLNRCSSVTGRMPGWMILFTTLLALSAAASAQETNVAPGSVPAPTNALSATKVPVLAPWQQKLTFGPGDIFDISMYGKPDSQRGSVVIAPDGRFSYLQALDVMAAGLTVDELRAQLETILMKYHLAPRVVLVPTAFHSKKYYILGNVNVRGAFPLDKPTTALEAIARAKGFLTAAPQRSSFNLADLSQAFLVRRQADGSFARESVDFEGLFQRGELQHNKLLAPDDYMYFPPVALQEVYVLGEVKLLGALVYTKNLTVLGAIAGRGGFTDGAFRQRILVVRGSLEHPETFVVDVGEILRAAAPDFALQPKDIVYVSRRPWAKAEELLQAAASDFVRAIVVTWTGQDIGPFINK